MLLAQGPPINRRLRGTRTCLISLLAAMAVTMFAEHGYRGAALSPHGKSIRDIASFLKDSKV